MKALPSHHSHFSYAAHIYGILWKASVHILKRSLVRSEKLFESWFSWQVAWKLPHDTLLEPSWWQKARSRSGTCLCAFGRHRSNTTADRMWWAWACGSSADRGNNNSLSVILWKHFGRMLPVLLACHAASSAWKGDEIWKASSSSYWNWFPGGDLKPKRGPYLLQLTGKRGAYTLLSRWQAFLCEGIYPMRGASLAIRIEFRTGSVVSFRFIHFVTLACCMCVATFLAEEACASPGRTFSSGKASFLKASCKGPASSPSSLTCTCLNF